MTRKRAKNLLLDLEALNRGESFCRRHGIALSRLVADYLRTLPDEHGGIINSAVVRNMQGLALGARPERDTYLEYLRSGRKEDLRVDFD